MIEAGIRTLADIRTAPRSRRHPHFDGGALDAALAEDGIAYVHLKGLGGWRRETPAAARHSAIRTPGFRAYAEHLNSADFAADYARLRELSTEAPTAFMCAETFWWRCHRRMLSDRLVSDGWEVVHLVAPGKSTAHRLSDSARLEGGEIIYDVGGP